MIDLLSPPPPCFLLNHEKHKMCIHFKVQNLFFFLAASLLRVWKSTRPLVSSARQADLWWAQVLDWLALEGEPTPWRARGEGNQSWRSCGRSPALLWGHRVNGGCDGPHLDALRSSWTVGHFADPCIICCCCCCCAFTHFGLTYVFCDWVDRMSFTDGEDGEWDQTHRWRAQIRTPNVPPCRQGPTFSRMLNSLQRAQTMMFTVRVCQLRSC